MLGLMRHCHHDKHMSKAIVVKDNQLEHAVRVAKMSSRDNGTRDVALLLTCFGISMTVTEISRLNVSNYLCAAGQVLQDSQSSFQRGARQIRHCSCQGVPEKT